MSHVRTDFQPDHANIGALTEPCPSNRDEFFTLYLLHIVRADKPDAVLVISDVSDTDLLGFKNIPVCKKSISISAEYQNGRWSNQGHVRVRSLGETRTLMNNCPSLIRIDTSLFNRSNSLQASEHVNVRAKTDRRV